MNSLFKKKKSNELDFYYLSRDNKDKRVQKKKHPKKKMKKKNPEPMNDNMFNIDNEIVIGVTVLPDKKKGNQNNKQVKNKKGQAKKKGKNTKNKNNRQQTNFDIYDDRINNNYNRKNPNKKKRKQYKKISPEEERKRRIRKEKRLKIIKAILKIILFIAIIAGIAAFLLVSPVFNIKEISVSGNNKIQATEIESLSQLNIEQNIFRFSKETVKNNIKQNAYIDSVEIKRKLPNKIEINVTERTPAYQIKFGNAFAYIDEKEAVTWYRKAADQGYIIGQLSVGYMYKYGLGVTKSYRQALEWYQKAANQGDELAIEWAAEIKQLMQ